jgi:hypothetical protein
MCLMMIFCTNIPECSMLSPCHHNMARSQTSDGGDGHQIRRVAANILNKQSWTADRGCPPAWMFGVGLTTPHRKTPNLLSNVLKSIVLGKRTQVPKNGYEIRHLEC